MGYQNFSVQVTSFDTRVTASRLYLPGLMHSRRVRDFADVAGAKIVDAKIADAALTLGSLLVALLLIALLMVMDRLSRITGSRPAATRRSTAITSTA